MSGFLTSVAYTSKLRVSFTLLASPQVVVDESDGGGEAVFVLKADWDANEAAGAACAKWCKLLKHANVLFTLYHSGSSH